MVSSDNKQKANQEQETIIETSTAASLPKEETRKVATITSATQQPSSSKTDSDNNNKDKPKMLHSTSHKDKLKLFTSKDWVGDYKPDHVDVEYSKNHIFDSDSDDHSDDSSTASTVAPQDAVPALKNDESTNGTNTGGSDLLSAASKKAAPPIDFIAEYNRMFGGSAASSSSSSQKMPVPTKLTSAASSGVASLTSIPSMSFLERSATGASSTSSGALLPDASLAGTSLDIRTQNTNSLIEQATAALVSTPGAVTTTPKKEEDSQKSTDAKQQKTETKKSKPRRPRRKKKPEPPKQYIEGEPTNLDVLLGRGGRSNHWEGNKKYRSEVQNLQHWYKASEKNEKTDLSQCLVNYVHSYGGRFLKLDGTCSRWYVVSNLIARRKASQALREFMTPEQREVFKAERKARLEATKETSEDGDDEMVVED